MDGTCEDVVNDLISSGRLTVVVNGDDPAKLSIFNISFPSTRLVASPYPPHLSVVIGIAGRVCSISGTTIVTQRNAVSGKDIVVRMIVTRPGGLDALAVDQGVKEGVFGKIEVVAGIALRTNGFA